MWFSVRFANICCIIISGLTSNYEYLDLNNNTSAPRWTAMTNVKLYYDIIMIFKKLRNTGP